MKVTIFFVMFFAIFFLLTLLFRKKVLRFEEKTYSEKTPSVIAERVEWKRYYDKPNKKGYQVYEYEINEKVCHRTFHDQDRVMLGAAYGGRFLNDKIKLYHNGKGKLLPLRNVFFKNSYAIVFAVVSALIPLVIIYYFIR